jgi:hypothetical protein
MKFLLELELIQKELSNVILKNLIFFYEFENIHDICDFLVQMMTIRSLGSTPPFIK